MVECFYVSDFVFRKEIKPTVGTLVFYHRTGNLCKVFVSIAMVIKGGDKFKVPVIGGFHDRKQLVQAVDTFFQWGFLFM